MSVYQVDEWKPAAVDCQGVKWFERPKIRRGMILERAIRLQHPQNPRMAGAD
jgi:hypothetical protein